MDKETEQTLLEKTLVLAGRVTVSVVRLCRDAGVTTRWYYKFINGEIKDPSVNKVQRLHDCLRSYEEQDAA